MNEMVNAYRASDALAAEYASPHQLISMLFDGALERLARAIGHVRRGEVAEKGECIGRVVLILDTLQSSLDSAAGDGALAGNLADLYDYMMLRLTEANLRTDPAILTEVHGLLDGLADAWRSIGPELAAAEGRDAGAANGSSKTSGIS
ncbi:flagellar export chaperone FliS [Chromatocurvus halotolerans]|uniref:Flagellar secretion chaperone FliS n=1 Tax=Chromatocurvus halotolerans TaxID=1132028 RepID=A0A4R2KYV0_9GAMM|nr:flagellar export chaperone FliS [Chromatocurvus halotolerans]TCO76609.1 flagellar protein FliS [Chromatocurvus halotolerans]